MDEWYKKLPPVTRIYVTLCLATTAACSLEMITPFNIYYNVYFIFQKHEYWRLLTNFLYFGSFNMDFVFHIFFLVKYSKTLEEGSFRGKSADFLWMLLLGATLLSVIAPFADVRFLGNSLTFMMVYVWARRNPYMTLSFLGVMTFTAPYLPWVLLGFSILLGSSPTVDLLGMFVGHLYYFLEDVYPNLTRRRVLKTPSILKLLFSRVEQIQEMDQPTVDPGENVPFAQQQQQQGGFPAPGVVPPPGGIPAGNVA